MVTVNNERKIICTTATIKQISVLLSEMLRATISDLGAGVCMPYALLTHCFREKPTIRLSHVSDDNVAVCLGVQSFFYL